MKITEKTVLELIDNKRDNENLGCTTTNLERCSTKGNLGAWQLVFMYCPNHKRRRISNKISQSNKMKQNTTMKIFLVMKHARLFKTYFFFKRLKLRKSRAFSKQALLFPRKCPAFSTKTAYPRIDFKKSILPAYAAWRAGTVTLVLLGS